MTRHVRGQNSSHLIYETAVAVPSPIVPSPISPLTPSYLCQISRSAHVTRLLLRVYIYKDDPLNSCLILTGSFSFSNRRLFRGSRLSSTPISLRFSKMAQSVGAECFFLGAITRWPVHLAVWGQSPSNASLPWSPRSASVGISKPLCYRSSPLSEKARRVFLVAALRACAVPFHAVCVNSLTASRCSRKTIVGFDWSRERVWLSHRVLPRIPRESQSERWWMH